MEFKIANNLDDIYRVENELLAEIERADYDENACFAIRLALDEALINAFKHGNAQEPDKTILLRAKIGDTKVEVEVEDEGPGFDRSQLQDPRRGESLRRSSGRGVFLIRQFMSGTRFNEKGNIVTFSYPKRKSLEGQDAAHWSFEHAEVLELDPVRILKTPELIQTSTRQLIAKGKKWIILDLRFLEKIDSATLGFMIAATREAEQQGGALALARPQPQIERIIRTTSLDVVLKAFRDIRKALEHLENRFKSSRS